VQASLAPSKRGREETGVYGPARRDACATDCYGVGQRCRRFRYRCNEIQEIFFIQRHPTLSGCYHLQFLPPPLSLLAVSARSLGRFPHAGAGKLGRSRECCSPRLTLLPTEILIKKLALITTDTRLPRSASHRAHGERRHAARGSVQPGNSTNAF